MSAQLARFTLQGVNGSRISIHGPGSESSPVRLESGDLGQFWDTPVETTYKARAGRPGTQFRGARELERQIELNLVSYDAARDPLTWGRVDSELRKAFSYDENTRIECDTELSGQRVLSLRLVQEPEYQEEVDAHGQALARWKYRVIAPDPAWLSPQITDAFRFNGINWYGETITVSNPSDSWVWPKWVCTAPAKFGLPDPDFVGGDLTRTIALPFQPWGHEVTINTDPGAEQIVDTRNALLWAQMGGQFFNGRIPPRTPPTELPIWVDPLPMLGQWLPEEGRRWFAQKMQAFAIFTGLDKLLAMTANELGALMASWVRDITPDWLEGLGDWLLPALAPEKIAEAIAEQWNAAVGSITNLTGATAQIRIDQRWSRPWGME